MDAWIQSFGTLDPILQALVAGLFTWGMTALGALAVFFIGKDSQRFLDTALGAAAGVMIAASFWSLLAPALALADAGPLPAWLPVSIGFLAGGAAIWGIDKLLPHLHLSLPIDQAEGVATKWRRSTLLVLAITLHNLPEGLAVGVAFGAAAAGLPSATMAGAVVLALGMGLQNIPEGVAVALPLRREGMSRRRSFFFGQLSAIVEPVMAVVGAVVVLQSQAILPYALSFAAGAMIFVVIEELIPESQAHGDTDRATLGAMIGFVVMMILDNLIG